MSNPIKSGAFNVSFFLPILDVVMFVLLAGSAGYWYYSRQGVEVIADSHRETAELLATYEQEIRDTEDTIVAALEDKQKANIEYQALIAEAELVERQIKLEHEKIQNATKRDRELTDQFVALRRDIEKSDDRRRAKLAEILGRRTEIEEIEGLVAILDAEVADSLARRNGVENDIAELSRERERDPISIFPPGAGLAITVELEESDQIFGMSLSGVVKQFGDINVGLSGNLGLARDARASVKEGGFFVNIPVAFRRASIDLETGLASLTNSAGNENIAGFLAATFRYAPMRKERFFLLGGTKFRDEDLSLRIGVGFGRR